MRSRETRIPDETYLSLMRAVIVALNKHGYVGLTMRNIAAEFDRSRGLLHYHFEDKQELLGEVWSFVFDRYDQSVDVHEETSAEERLRSFLSVMLFGPDDADIDHWEVQTALLEFQMIARHDEWLRGRVERVENRRIGLLTGILERGIDDGEFRRIDADGMARFLIGAVHAARTRKICLGWESAPDRCWETLSTVVVPLLRENE